MRSPLHNDEFEHFLQKQVNQHRIYPSDHIWRNIQQEIHGYRRWPALTFVSLTVISLLVAGTLLVKPETKIKNIEAYALAQKQEKANASVKPSDTIYQETMEDRLSTTKLTEKTIAAVKIKLDKHEVLPSAETAARTAVAEDNLNAVASHISSKPAETENKPASIAIVNGGSMELLPAAGNRSVDLSIFNSSLLQSSNTNAISLNLPNVYSLNNEYTGAGKFSITKNKFGARNRFSFLFYLTPSSSYRKLVDDKEARINSSYLPGNTNINFADANQIVRQKPAMGIEIGFGIGYSLSKRLTLKTGLQFNVRQYNIEAYNSFVEPATIGLGDNSTLRTVSSYSSLSGSSPVTLRNKNYEISIPIGLDYKIIDAGNVSWNIAGALQPTYIFDKEPFLLSTDLKSYANGASIMRNWNLNTSLETYLSIQSGDYRWQIGPQFRYQNLPTYINKYPIKEHLLDYGIKIGFSKKLGH